MTPPQSAFGDAPSGFALSPPGGGAAWRRRAWVAAASILVTAHAAADLSAPAALPRALSEPALQTPKALGAAMLAVTRAGNRLVAAGERGTVLLSDDGGKQWRQARVPVQGTLTALRFIDERTGWATGHLGVILKTEDGGQTWTKQLDGVGAAQLLLEAARSSGDEALQRTAQRYAQEGPDKPFFDIDFADAQHGIAVGAYNLAFRTVDGGKTWAPLSWRLPNAKNLHLYGVRMAAGHVFIAGEQGLLMKSPDGGANFAPLASPYKGSFFGLLAAPSGTLVAYGLRGNAFRSADQGKSWDKIETSLPVSISAGVTLDGGALALLGQTGQVLVSRNDGRTFTKPPAAAEPVPAVGLAPSASGTLVFASLRGMRSTSAP